MTWAGPVDISRVEASGWVSGRWRKLGGRDELSRWERRQGRVILRVEGFSGRFVTISRQNSNFRVKSSSELEQRFGADLGHSLLLMQVSGASRHNTMLLGISAAGCGASDIAIEALRASSALLGGGANKWSADLLKKMKDAPESLSALSALVDSNGRPRGGVKPKSLSSALSTAGRIRSATLAARQEGAESPSRRRVSPERRPASDSGTRDGWELVMDSDPDSIPELLRSAARLGEARLSSEAGRERIVLPLQSLDKLVPSVSAAVRTLQHLLVAVEEPTELPVGLPGLGIRFRFAAEFGAVTSQDARCLKEPLEVSSACQSFRREAENRRFPLTELAKHVAASGSSIAAMTENAAVRIVRLASEGFSPESYEWRTMMGVE